MTRLIGTRDPRYGRIPLNDSFYTLRALAWSAVYHHRETQLGSTATLVPFGDEQVAGLVSASTFTGKRFNASGLAPTWTPSAALSTWARPLDLGTLNNYLGAAPILKANGTSEDITTPDAAYWTRATAAASWGFWVNIATGSDDVLMAKYDMTTGSENREWTVQWLDGLGPYLEIYDETANAFIARRTTTEPSKNAWHQLVFTYSGGTADTAIAIYVDGGAATVTNAGSGVFTTMRDTTTTVRLFSRIETSGSAGSYFVDQMLGGPFGPFFVQAELTAAQVDNLYDFERQYLGV